MMLAIVLALAAAISFGGSDYAGGLAARKASVLKVSVLAELARAVLLLTVVPLVSTWPPSVPGLAWGAAAGVSGVAGGMALYLGFRHAAFSVASSVSAVTAAALPVLVGLLSGERPGALSLAGMALTLPAIVALSVTTSGQGPDLASGRHLAGVGWGIIAGVGFGFALIGLHRAGSQTDLWPLAAAALAAVATAASIAAAKGQLSMPPVEARGLSLLTGIIAATGTFSYFLATHRGLLAVTAVIYSLYPAGTIGLARIRSGERLTAMKIIGLCLAAVSVGLIAVAAAHGVAAHGNQRLPSARLTAQ